VFYYALSILPLWYNANAFVIGVLNNYTCLQTSKNTTTTTATM